MNNVSDAQDYIYTTNTIMCKACNLELYKYENKVLKYNNTLYLCNIQNSRLVLSPYSPAVWNNLISMLDTNSTVDILEIKNNDAPHTINVENADRIPTRVLSPGISFIISNKTNQCNIKVMLHSLKNIVQTNACHSEIIFVNTEDVLKEIEKTCLLLDIKNVFLYNYTEEITPQKDNAAVYNNWCIEKCNLYNFIQWSSNFVAIPSNIMHMFESYNISKLDKHHSIWFSGKTLYKYNNEYFININSRYNEFGIFSKKHGANYVKLTTKPSAFSGDVAIDKKYLKDSQRKVFTKCVFLEYIILHDTFVSRDAEENKIIHDIRTNNYVNYKNRFSFFENIVKLPCNKLSRENEALHDMLYCILQTPTFTYLTVTNFQLNELQNFWINNYIKDETSKIQFYHPENILIQGLWVGNTLETLHNMCVKSFVRNSHMYVLYTYEKVENVPDNVVIMDGNEIIPASLIYKFSDSYAGFSNLFRNALLYQKGGWYVDLDIYNVKRYDFPQKSIFSLDYYPPMSQKMYQFRKKKNAIIGKEFYVASNPVKVTKKDPIFLSQFKYVLDKVMFGKLKDLLPTTFSREKFDIVLTENDLLELFYAFYTNKNKSSRSFLDLLHVNNIHGGNVRQKYWGELGPILCTRSVINNNRINECATPEVFQGIIKYNEIHKFFDKNIDYSRLKNTYSIDLFYTMWKQGDMLKRLEDKEKITHSLIYDMLHFNALS
tara:strand:+ start:68 stop:2215 length:2148 start_codon:yes stop_codon:yes gene_type:complete